MFRRAFTCALASLFVFGVPLRSADAGDRHAAFILDANTGAVLHNSEGDEPRHPASLTKMMTLYLTFETLQSGRLKMSDKLTISEAAADVAPSKLDLDPGDQITVSDAIRAVITKSANDIAVALAERIGGSEANFAHLMNTRARELGMMGTHYENASGLPNDDQITTARDMATLALHLQDDYPQYYPLFATRVFSYDGKSFRNHNTMLNTLPGIDGIKTGYTRASGFNLVTSWHRGDRHLIGVVFGGDTAGERNAEMRALLTRMVYRASSVRTRRPMLLARLRGEPKIALRPAKRKPATAIAEAKRAAPADTEPAERPAVIADAAETPVHIFKVRAVPLLAQKTHPAPSPDETTDMEDTGRPADFAKPPMQQAAPSANRVADAEAPTNAVVPPLRAFAPTNLGNQRQAADIPPPSEVHRDAPRTTLASAEPRPPRPTPAKHLKRPRQKLAAEMHDAPVIRGTPPSTLGAQARALGDEPGRGSGQISNARYAVQIGAYGSIDDAQRALSNIQDRTGRLLAGVTSVTNPAIKDGHQIFRARFTGLDAERATSTCNVLRRQAVDCFVMAGE